LNKRHKLNLVLNAIKQVDDPTIVACTFIILDFDKSNNNVIVPKDVALEAGKTLINKPIVAKYYEVETANTKTDNFGSHQESLGEDRYGNVSVDRDTVPIGVFTTEGYELTINVNGEDKEVMAADAVLWRSRFPDAIDLLFEWYNNGISIMTSCEYLYANYSFENGIEYHNSPIYFEGHCVLASENRGDHGIVYPAYDSATLLSFNEINQFNRLVAQAINQKQEKESEIMPELFRKVCELSHGDIRTLLYNQLDPTLGESEYSYIADVYESYFVVNLYSWAEGNEYDKYFKFNYTSDEKSVNIDFESKSEVFASRNWEEVVSEEIQTQLNEKESKIEEITTQLNEVSVRVETLATEKEEVQTQFNATADKLTQLNSQLEELKPFKEKFEEAEFEKAFNEKKDFYLKKFNALKATEKFESEEVQNLIKQAINSNEEGKNAILQLNTMLVEMVELVEEPEENPVVREMASKRENLVPTSDDFESRYKI
jgi:hypothetical protein